MKTLLTCIALVLSFQVFAEDNPQLAAVKAAETANIALPDLPLDVLQKLEPRITDKVFAVLTVDASVASRQSYGGDALAAHRFGGGGFGRR